MIKFYLVIGSFFAHPAVDGLVVAKRCYGCTYPTLKLQTGAVRV